MTDEQIKKEESSPVEKTGANENSNNRVSNDSAESVIERAERLNKETKEIHEKIQHERERIEKIATNKILSGNISVPPQEDPAKKEADEIVNAFKR